MWPQHEPIIASKETGRKLEQRRNKKGQRKTRAAGAFEVNDLPLKWWRLWYHLKTRLTAAIIAVVGGYDSQQFVEERLYVNMFLL